MKSFEIIKEFYRPGSKAFDLLVRHGKNVARKALEVSRRVADLNPDINFIREAAMLHDIGIFLTDTPELGCTGKHPYVCHGYLGRELLESKGLPLHALVCERHVGVGISAEEIRRLKLPLPERDMVPVSLEEQIVCFADKFFSKNGDGLETEKSEQEILKNLAGYGTGKAAIFQTWMRRFSGTSKH